MMSLVGFFIGFYFNILAIYPYSLLPNSYKHVNTTGDALQEQYVDFPVKFITFVILFWNKEIFF